MQVAVVGNHMTSPVFVEKLTTALQCGRAVNEPDGIFVRVVTNPDDWLLIRTEWSVLLERAKWAAPALHFDWLWNWWSIYGSPGSSVSGELRLLTAYRGSRLVGVLPLYCTSAGRLGIRPRTLRFLSTGEAEFEETCADYLDMLCLPSEDAKCSEAFRSAIASLSWDEIALDGFSEQSRLRCWSDTGITNVRCQVASDGLCAIADLTSGFGAFLQRLSSNAREQSRRIIRQVDNSGVSIQFANPETTKEFFTDLTTLHQLRWTSKGKPGCFASPKFAEFHRLLSESWIPTGRALILRLALGSRPLAIIYGFLAAKTFYFYQSGIDAGRDLPLKSPGIAAHLVLMRHLAERGIERYDFLKGTQAYKTRLATDDCQTFRFTAQRHTLRSLLHETTQSMKGAIRSCRRVIGGIQRLSSGSVFPGREK